MLALLAAGARAHRWEGRAAPGSRRRSRNTPPAAAWARGGVVVNHALDAARELNDPAAEGWALHQRGSRALCLGDRELATTALGPRRWRCGRSSATRRAPRSRGGTTWPSSAEGQRRPRRTAAGHPSRRVRAGRGWPVGVGVLVAGVVAAALAAGGGSEPSATTADPAGVQGGATPGQGTTSPGSGGPRAARGRRPRATRAAAALADRRPTRCGKHRPRSAVVRRPSG